MTTKRGYCWKTGKRRWRDEIAAKMALARARNDARKSRRQECRAYQCPECQGWHLTSKK